MAVSSFWDQYWAVHVTLVAVTEACKVIVCPSTRRSCEGEIIPIFLMRKLRFGLSKSLMVELRA